MARQVGRPRKAGERYASGDLKSKRDEGDVRAPTLWRRIKDGAVRGAAHPYAGTVLGRLSIFGALSDAERPPHPARSARRPLPASGER